MKFQPDLKQSMQSLVTSMVEETRKQPKVDNIKGVKRHLARIMDAKKKKISEAEVFLLPSQRAKIRKEQGQLQADQSRTVLGSVSSEIYLVPNQPKKANQSRVEELMTQHKMMLQHRSRDDYNPIDSNSFRESDLFYQGMGKHTYMPPQYPASTQHRHQNMPSFAGKSMTSDVFPAQHSYSLMASDMQNLDDSGQQQEPIQ